MHPRLFDLLRFLDRMSGKVLPSRFHERLRSLAIGYLLAGRQPAILMSSEDVSVRFIACSGEEIEDFTVAESYASAPAAPFARVKCALVVCCAFTGRHRVLRRAIEESLSSRNGKSVRWMLVGTTPEDLDFIRALAQTTDRVAGFLCENHPLGRKWNRCIVQAGRHYDASLYAITGSDDILSARLVDHVVERARAETANGVGKVFLPAVYASLEWLVVVTDMTHRACPQVLKSCYAYDAAFQPLGAGRFYTRAFLEEVDFEIFDSKLERLLDDRGYFEVRNRGKAIDYLTLEDGPIISVKGNWAQMNKLDDLFDADQLDLRDFSFEGCRLLKDSLSGATFRYLFKPGRTEAQFNFSAPPLGVSYTDSASS